MDEERNLVAIVLIMWYLLPAYLANTVAALVGGGAPIDGGHNWSDGKTGVLVLEIGNPISGVENNILDLEGNNYIYISAVLSFGALFGDMLASFVKRRMGFERGSMALGLDQYDFVVVSLVMTWMLYGEWIEELFIEHLWREMMTIFVLTPLLHRGVNIIGYKMGVKNEPW